MKKYKIIITTFLVLSLISTIVMAETTTCQVLKNSPKGIWFWDATKMNNRETITNLVNHNIENVYVNVGWEPSVQQFYLQANKNKYQAFIKNANSKGIKVEALYGNPDWGLVKNLQDLKNQVKIVLDYNKDTRYKFNAIQLDIEPYLLSEWTTEKERVIKEFINNINEVKIQINEHNKLNKDNLTLTIIIPNWIHQFSYDNKNFAEEVFKIADKVCLMNYTIYDGYYLETSKIYLDYAKLFNKKLTIGSEFQQGEEYSTLSLYYMPKEDIDTYFNNLYNLTKNYEGYFENISVHEYDSYLGFFQSTL